MRSTPAPYFCPLCRGSFQKIEPLPDVRLDGAAWFKVVKSDIGGALGKSEVIDALCATLPVDSELLSKSLEGGLWKQWDMQGTGCITREVFEEPARGLLQFVLYRLPSLQISTNGAFGRMPDIFNCREGWFRFWDEHSRQFLEFLELLRAIVRTLRLDGAPEDAGIVRSVLMNVWLEYGLVSGSSALEEQQVLKPVSLKLFCEKPDGLCDVLVDGLNKTFGAIRFGRLRQRAHLLQQPVLSLKRELKKLGFGMTRALEKNEMVESILNAKDAASFIIEVRTTSSLAEKVSVESAICSDTPSTSSLKLLSLGEIRDNLRMLGVSYHHCVERAELEELLLKSQRHGDGSIGGQIHIDPFAWASGVLNRASSTLDEAGSLLETALEQSGLIPVDLGANEHEGHSTASVFTRGVDEVGRRRLESVHTSDGGETLRSRMVRSRSLDGRCETSQSTFRRSSQPQAYNAARNSEVRIRQSNTHPGSSSVPAEQESHYHDARQHAQGVWRRSVMRR